jgi:hypothetical protein
MKLSYKGREGIMKKIRVKFHLGAGKYKGWWQIKNNEEVLYVNPVNQSIWMKSCKLRIQPSMANKIFGGANRSVCGWIDCEEYKIINKNREEVEESKRIFFNPKKNPNWIDVKFDIINNQIFSQLQTNYFNLYKELMDV